MRSAHRHPDAVMFGSTQIDAQHLDLFDGTGDAYFAAGVAWRGNHGRPSQDVPPEGETFAPCAAAALYRSDAFRDAGGFDKRFFCYYEDVDLAFRLRLAGGRCIQVPKAVVHHVGSSVAGHNSPFTIYHLSRNQLWTFVKNMPGPLFWALLPGHLLLQVLLLIRAAQHGVLGPASRGLLDGLRGLGPILRERRKVQSARTVSWIHIAKALTWSPAKWLARRADLRLLG